MSEALTNRLGETIASAANYPGIFNEPEPYPPPSHCAACPFASCPTCAFQPATETPHAPAETEEP